MSDACPSCGGPIEPHSGPGRPSIYCGEGCRRAAEFSIRGLVRRIDKAELELRELLAPGGIYSRVGVSGYLGERERDQRAQALRDWLAQDQGRLRALLGANPRGSGAVS